MRSENSIEPDAIFNNCKQIYERFDTVLMATVSEDGVPDASYAPYVKKEQDYYIYISDLAAHTQNLRDNGQLSLLFIENEIEAQHLFARKRVTYRSEAFEIARHSKEFIQVMDVFAAKFGKWMDMLRKLQDFHLFKIHLVKGTYVQSFGQAFYLEGEQLDQVRYINDKSHRMPDKNSGLLMQQHDA